MRRLSKQEVAKYNTAPLQQRGLTRNGGTRLLKRVANQPHADKDDHEESAPPIRKIAPVDEDIDREPESSSDEAIETPKRPSQSHSPQPSQSQSQESAKKRKRKEDDEKLVDLEERPSLYQERRKPIFLRKKKYGGSRETTRPMDKPKKPVKKKSVFKNIHANEVSPESETREAKG